MSKLCTTIAQMLRDKGIAFELNAECIRILLPMGFGQLDISEDAGDSIVGLVNQEWHTHGDMLLPKYGENEAAAIMAFVEAIFAGELKMVEQRRMGAAPEKYIDDSYPVEDDGMEFTVFKP